MRVINNASGSDSSYTSTISLKLLLIINTHRQIIAKLSFLAENGQYFIGAIDANDNSMSFYLVCGSVGMRTVVSNSDSGLV